MSIYDEFAHTIKTAEDAFELAPYAKRSLENFSGLLVGEKSIEDYVEDQPTTGVVRTPLQRERDRVIHSPQFRRLTEKYHLIYWKNQKLVRNYVTHVLRAAQIARSIARHLALNQDFTESISMGAKVGCIPFPHVAKDVMKSWALNTLNRLRKQEERSAKGAGTLQLPSSFPMATLKGGEEPAYNAGKQSYWNYCTCGYLMEPSKDLWQKETIYGMWRHSLLEQGEAEKDFDFSYSYLCGTERHLLSSIHETYEAAVVRYADDITWVIENLHDASSASEQAGGKSLLRDVAAKKKLPLELETALHRNNAGQVYGYFVADMVQASLREIQKMPADYLKDREGLREGDGSPLICLSDEAFEGFKELKSYLMTEVFKADRRTVNRNQMLQDMLKFVADELYGEANASVPEVTEKRIRQRAQRSPYFDVEAVKTLAVRDPFFRVQLILTLMSDMSDFEVFEFVGISAL